MKSRSPSSRRVAVDIASRLVRLPRATVAFTCGLALILAVVSPGTAAVATSDSVRTHVHFAAVPVRTCRSQYASSGAGRHFPRIPRWKVIAIPGNLTDQVAVYVDTRQQAQVLGPVGWDCIASFGNGPVAFTIYPPSEKSPGFDPDRGGLQGRSGREGVNVLAAAAGYFGILQVVCPYFRSARAHLYRSYPWVRSSSCRVPRGEEVVPVNAQVKRVDDPPYSAGRNYPSGGAFWALGNAFFATYPGGGSYLMTCTLPTALHALCYASMARFEVLWIRGSKGK